MSGILLGRGKDTRKTLWKWRHTLELGCHKPRNTCVCQKLSETREHNCADILTLDFKLLHLKREISVVLNHWEWWFVKTTLGNCYSRIKFLLEALDENPCPWHLSFYRPHYLVHGSASFVTTPSLALRDLCNYIGPTQVVLVNLPISKSNHICKVHFLYKITY